MLILSEAQCVTTVVDFEFEFELTFELELSQFGVLIHPDVGLLVSHLSRDLYLKHAGFPLGAERARKTVPAMPLVCCPVR